MCVFPAAQKGTLLPPFTSSIALTNGAIWPLQPTGSSNTKSGVYGFEAPSAPSPTPLTTKSKETFSLHTWWALKLSEMKEKFRVRILCFLNDQNVILKKKLLAFLLQVYTNIQTWLQLRILPHSCSTVPFIAQFARTFCAEHISVCQRELIFLTVWGAFKPTGVWFASNFAL